MHRVPCCDRSNRARKVASGLARRASLVLASALRVFAVLALLATLPASAYATEVTLPADGSTVIGHPHIVTIPPKSKVTLLDIARHYDVGYQAIVDANPHVSVWIPGAGTRVVVPTEYILPPKPWKGIIINVPQRRLFYFPPKRTGKPRKVITFPVGIFQKGFPDPLGKTRIIAKFRDPKWVVPKDILEQAAKHGEHLPKVVKPGPYNPMGELALETGFSEIFIHGTSKPWGVGMRPSHGCFHLYPENARTAFHHIPVGTPVHIINDPLVVGRGPQGQIEFAAFRALKAYKKRNSMHAAVDLISDYVVRHGDMAQIDWLRVKHKLKALSPIPSSISVGTPSLKTRLSRIAAVTYKYPPYTDANNGTPPPPQKPIGAKTASSSSSSAKQSSTAKAAHSKLWTIQVAAFERPEDAARLVRRLRKHFAVDAFQTLTQVHGKTFHRVLAGHLKSQSSAKQLAAKLRKALGHPVTVTQLS